MPSTQDRKAEADHLVQQGIQQYQQGKSQEALETLTVQKLKPELAY